MVTTLDQLSRADGIQEKLENKRGDLIRGSTVRARPIATAAAVSIQGRTPAYQTRRDAFSKALSLCGLGEIIELLEQLLANHRPHDVGAHAWSARAGLAPDG